MGALIIGVVIFALGVGSTLVGMALHARLPDRHLDSDSKDVVKLVMALISTMAALVLGLLIASAQSSYSTQRGNLQALAADIAQMDHMLALYGPETKNARDLLRQNVAAVHDLIWASRGIAAENLNPRKLRDKADKFFDAVQSLTPKNDAQRFIQSQSLQLSAGMAQIRSLMFEQAGSSVSWPFLAVLMFWISVLFLGFGLFARPNATVVVALTIGSLSVAAAIFLILELGDPDSGLIRLSDRTLAWCPRSDRAVRRWIARTADHHGHRDGRGAEADSRV